MYSLSESVALVEKLDINEQRKLRELLSEAVYKKQLIHKKKRGEDFTALVSAGFLVKIDEPDGVILDSNLEKVRKKLCTYLSRRNEVDSYLDEEMKTHEIPKGAQFVATARIGSRSSLSLEFPDDDITELLDQYGVNRCRGWNP